MVKVQNNWEKQSIDELEEHISQQGSPISVSNRTPCSRLVFQSPTTAERHRRPSCVSDISDQMMVSPGQGTPSDLLGSLGTTSSCMLPFASCVIGFAKFYRSMVATRSQPYHERHKKPHLSYRI